MKNNTTRKTINVDKPNLMPLWSFKENDDAVLNISLFKEAVSFNITGQTIRLGAKTNAGLKEQVDGFAIQGNNLDIKLKNTILVRGLVEIDLEFTDAEGKMTSASFFINVDSKVLNDKSIQATNEFSTFKKTVAEIQEDYQGLRKIVINENNAANLQDQVNKTNASLEHIAINVYSFGAKGDGINDDTQSIQNTINYANTKKMNVYIPNGTYKITDSIIIPSNIRIYGADKYNSTIVLNLDKPIFRTIGGTVGRGNITIENIHFAPRSEIKTKYTLEMVNTYNTTIKNCYISGQPMNGKISVEGIAFTKATEYSDIHFVNKIESCQLTSASIVMESTDSYIINNEIWGNDRPYCVHIKKSSQFITGNQLVPSEDKGAIYIEDTTDGYDVEILRIESNYFDGSYSKTITGDGIIAKKLRLSNIVGNDFWHIKKSGIVLSDSHSVNITSNIFTDCNLSNNYYDDIKSALCTNLMLCSNTHKQSVNQTNKGKAYNFITSLGENSITNNSLYFTSNYATSIFTEKEVVRNNLGLSDKIGIYKFNNPSTYTTITGTETTIGFTNTISSSDGNVAILNNSIKLIKSGMYKVFYNIGSTLGNGARYVLFLYVNGIRKEKINDKILNGNDSINGTLIDYFNIGDTIELKYYCDKQISIASSSNDNYIIVTRF